MGVAQPGSLLRVVIKGGLATGVSRKTGLGKGLLSSLVGLSSLLAVNGALCSLHTGGGREPVSKVDVTSSWELLTGGGGRGGAVRLTHAPPPSSTRCATSR